MYFMITLLGRYDEYYFHSFFLLTQGLLKAKGQNIVCRHL